MTFFCASRHDSIHSSLPPDMTAIILHCLQTQQSSQGSTPSPTLYLSQNTKYSTHYLRRQDAMLSDMFFEGDPTQRRIMGTTNETRNGIKKIDTQQFFS